MKEVLKVLANRISRKAILLSTGMLLVYMVAITPTATQVLVTIGVIAGLALTGTLLQFYLDKKKIDKDKD